MFVLSADAKTAYYPASPSSTGQKLSEDVSIPLGLPGNTVTATVPRIAGGRIWFSVGKPIQFFVNPGPGLVEPSIFNPADPNSDTNFGFCEFTYNSWELFINISYVDFVSAVPIALTVQEGSGASKHVSGLKANGLDQVCQGLKDQTTKDGRRWGSLVVKSKDGQNLRALSPNSGILLNPSWFKTYWDDYINQGKPINTFHHSCHPTDPPDSVGPILFPTTYDQHTSLLRQRRRPSEEQPTLLREQHHYLPEAHSPRHLRLLDRTFRNRLQRRNECYHPPSGRCFQPQHFAIV